MYGSLNYSSKNTFRYQKVIWTLGCAAIILLVILLAALTFLRIKFPWDTYFWPESPFLTNMLKLHNHLPVYTAPADGNSFVYAPGLEYICYGVLHPFGLELDIRWCRALNVLLGMLACVFAALAMGRIARPKNGFAPAWFRFLIAFGVAWLVLSKNPMADVMHPDNLQAFHAVSVFYLCLTAMETARFDLALVTMAWAGLGVFSKQTEAVSFLGVTAVFAWFNPWGWRRTLFLAAVGASVVAVSLYALWLPHYARFFTFQLMSHQGVFITKLYHVAVEMLTKDRGLLLYLAIIAAFYLWDTNPKNRRYLICWTMVGICAVAPNLLAFLKSMGAYNNLILFEVWFIMIVWPVFIQLLDRLASGPSFDFLYARTSAAARFPVLRCALVIVLLFLLTPTKHVPLPVQYEYSRKIEALVRQDFQEGHKVLVSHGTEYLIRAGFDTVPLDRCNSILELYKGGMSGMAEAKSRIHAHYYDRIYLVLGSWYSPDILKEIKQDYIQESVIAGPTVPSRFEEGFGGGLMEDCQVMVPRPGPQLPPIARN